MARRVTESKIAPSVAVILCVVTLMAVVGKHTAFAQASCNSALASLSPCLNYVTGQDAAPNQGCCSALASVVKNKALCLCQLLASNSSSINRNRALALPGECNVTTPPVSQCQGSGAPNNTSPASNGTGTQITKATGSNPSSTNEASGIFVLSSINVVAIVVFAAFLSW
ncbi:non-specific lipid transfer protein GPI-anchored 5 [Cryptomeria japonica]|uniref:non-specific lipid transfer protein GPI-anchored 5 n=1 Tax=Cryptomeria japonica TaxID=3369 RepID=UPI0025ACA2E8|nr:non-specific lipid transfer protein GPI-anchored 5 [Cryptomeria japonica]